MSDSDDLVDLVVCDGLGGGVITKSEVAVLLDGAVFRVDAFLAPAVGPDFPFLFPSLSEGVWCGLLFLLPPVMVRWWLLFCWWWWIRCGRCGRIIILFSERASDLFRSLSSLSGENSNS